MCQPPVLPALLASLLALSACSKAPEPAFVTTRYEIMATSVVVELPTEQAALAPRVREVFEEVEATANEWRPGSPLALVNNAAGGAPVMIPPALEALISRSLRLADQTDGAFDPTWAALWGLWDFRAERPQLPDPAEISARLPLVDFRRVELDTAAHTVRLPETGMKLGLGGIAKGYALDLAVAQLHEAGVRDFLLQAGGQVYAGGQKEGASWRTGIRHPRGGPEEIFGVMALSDRSASTSGDYERFFELDGRRYHHVLDPRTGWPAKEARSVTVVAADATLADGLSTALMVMGLGPGLALVETLAGVEAVVMDEEGRVWRSSGAAVELVGP